LALIGGAIGKRKRLLKPAEDAFANLLMMLTSGFCVCGHSEFSLRRGCESTRQLSSSLARNAWMRSAVLRRTKSARVVVQLPIRSQMTLGAPPSKELL
jgi:hypothetical protein